MPYAILRFSCRPGMFFSPYSRFLYLPRTAGTLTLSQAGIYLCRLISRAFFFSPDTFSPAMARRYTIRPPHSTHSNGSRLRNCFSICTQHTFATGPGLSIPGALGSDPASYSISGGVWFSGQRRTVCYHGLMPDSQMTG